MLSEAIALLAQFMVLYPRFLLYSEVKKSTTVFADGLHGLVCFVSQNRINCCAYVSYCLRVPGRHDEIMMSAACLDMPCFCRFSLIVCRPLVLVSCVIPFLYLV